MEINGRIIIADDGKVLRRIADQQVFSWRVHLGYTYYLGGQVLKEPLWELPEHYEEIDYPETMSAEEKIHIRSMRDEYEYYKNISKE